MSNENDKSARQRKIDNILALMSGELLPEELFPDCTMYIGYGEGDNRNLYKVNGKMVSKEVYDRAMGRMPVQGVFNITYGNFIEDNE